MIRSFRNKALAELWSTGKSSKIDRRLHARIVRRIDVIAAAQGLEDMKIQGFDFHSLRGFDPTRYTIHVNGPWCITFEFDGEDVGQLDFEQYH